MRTDQMFEHRQAGRTPSDNDSKAGTVEKITCLNRQVGNLVMTVKKTRQYNTVDFQIFKLQCVARERAT